MIDLNKWAEAYQADREGTKCNMIAKATKILSDCLVKGWYTTDDLVDLNYSEICENLGWPDLQDDGVFEQCIDLAADVALAVNGYKSRAEIKKLRK